MSIRDRRPRSWHHVLVPANACTNLRLVFFKLRHTTISPPMERTWKATRVETIAIAQLVWKQTGKKTPGTGLRQLVYGNSREEARINLEGWTPGHCRCKICMSEMLFCFLHTKIVLTDPFPFIDNVVINLLWTALPLTFLLFFYGQGHKF